MIPGAKAWRRPAGLTGPSRWEVCLRPSACRQGSGPLSGPSPVRRSGPAFRAPPRCLASSRSRELSIWTRKHVPSSDSQVPDLRDFLPGSGVELECQKSLVCEPGSFRKPWRGASGGAYTPGGIACMIHPRFIRPHPTSQGRPRPGCGRQRSRARCEPGTSGSRPVRRFPTGIHPAVAGPDAGGRMRVLRLRPRGVCAEIPPPVCGQHHLPLACSAVHWGHGVQRAHRCRRRFLAGRRRRSVRHGRRDLSVAL